MVYNALGARPGPPTIIGNTVGVVLTISSLALTLIHVVSWGDGTSRRDFQPGSAQYL